MVEALCLFQKWCMARVFINGRLDARIELPGAGDARLYVYKRVFAAVQQQNRQLCLG